MPDLVAGWRLSSHARLGYFGKLPGRPDFVAKGLPETFLSPLADWLERCLAAARASLDERWSELYLVSPVWHALLPAGLCGPEAAMMALVPSLDRSRREFPFVVATCLMGDAKPGALAATAAGWLEDLGEIAVGAVTGVHELGRLDAILRERESRLDVPNTAPRAAVKPDFIRLSGPEIRSPGPILPHLLDLCSGASSLWWTRGSALVEPTVLQCRELPAARRFAALIDGRWTAHGW